MSDTDLFVVLASCALTSVCAWLAMRQWLQALPDGPASAVQQPPGLWRYGVALIRPTARVVASVMPLSLQDRVTASIAAAGLDARLNACEFMAGRLVGAVVIGAAAAWGAVVVPDVLAGTSRPALSSDTSSSWALIAMSCGAVLGWLMPASWLREQRAARVRSVLRALPFYLDVITLSVESGANLTMALQHAVTKGPAGPLKEELERVLMEVRTGRTRTEALRALAQRLDLPAVSNWVAALIGAQRQGSSLGPILRAQAEQRRQERFLAAEKLAMKAPVKMLFPLLVFIFPCTFVLLLFPVAVRLIQEGLLK